MITTFIYELEDPRTKIPFYIGKADDPEYRLKRHIKEISKKNIEFNLNIDKVNILESILNSGLKPIINVIDEVKVDQWSYWEIYWIAQYKVWGFNITNIAEGGNGGDVLSNHPNKKEIFENLKLKLTGRKNTCDKIKCEYCNNLFFPNIYTQFHGERCKENLNPSLEELKRREILSNKFSILHTGRKNKKQEINICTKCGEERSISQITRNHNENCIKENRKCLNIKCNNIFLVSKKNKRKYCSLSCSISQSMRGKISRNKLN